jgi:hypothetical protein
LPQPRLTRFAVRFVVLGATAGILAGYSAYAMRPSSALPAGFGGEFIEPQTSNAAAKTNRLPFLQQTSLTAGYSLASAPQSADLNRFYDMVTAATPAIPLVEPPAAEPEPEAKESTAPAPVPHKVVRLPAPPQRPSDSFLDDTQISSLRGRLRLTSDQVEYWPAVETALRDVVRTQLRDTRAKQTRGGKMNIDVNSPEVQKLIWAAMPLIMRLREDQKREVRKLARVIGLEQVASQI